MKTCSKCQRQLDESNFVKSPRYLDGRYPSCKECKKKAKIKTLLDHPTCSRCKKNPHLRYTNYCLRCWREIRQRPVVPLRSYDPKNKEWCCKCKQRPRQEYHNYCRLCQNESQRKWQQAQKLKNIPDEKRRKKTARHYVNTLFKRGKIKRQPCERCGAQSQHFHHLDYKDRTTNIQHLCLPCHVEAEREKRNLTNVSA